jgi:hypothetical protein
LTFFGIADNKLLNITSGLLVDFKNKEKSKIENIFELFI